MRLRHFLTCLVLALPAPALALTGGEGVTLRSSELDGNVSFGGGCAGHMLTNEWVFTAAHCYKINLKNPRKDFVYIGGDETRGTKFEVDNAMSFPVVYPASGVPDIRVMKLKRPAVINGLTTGFVTRVLNETKIPAALIGKDFSQGNSPFIHMGSGSNEVGGDRLRKCTEAVYWGAKKPNILTFLRFDHDEIAGMFPGVDLAGIACNYGAGDSGAATLYRDIVTREWQVIAGCAGLAEGTCIAASNFEAFVLDKVWGGVRPAGLSVSDPRVRPGATIKVHFDLGGHPAKNPKIAIVSAACSDDVLSTSTGVCKPISETRANTGTANVIKLPFQKPGRFQIRLYNDGKLLRATGLHVGGAIQMHDWHHRPYDIALMTFSGMKRNSQANLYLTPRSDAFKANAKVGPISKRSIAALEKHAISYVIDADQSGDASLRMGLDHQDVRPDTEMDLTLIDTKAGVVLDHNVVQIVPSVIKNSPGDVWAVVPRGYDVNEDMRIMVAGQMHPGQPLKITLQHPISGSTRVLTATSRNQRGPFTFRVDKADVQALGVASWKVLGAETMRYSNMPILDTSVIPFTFRDNWDFRPFPITLRNERAKPAEFLHLSRVDVGLNRDRAAADFHKVSVDVQTTHPDISSGKQVYGAIISAWTDFPGRQIAEANCPLVGNNPFKCDMPRTLDMAAYLRDNRCFEIRVQVDSSLGGKVAADPFPGGARVRPDAAAMIARKRICK